MKEIQTSQGIYKYKEVSLYLGWKKIDREIATRNLTVFNAIMQENNVKFGLIYGTLLGAVREQNIIEHDEDIDLFILAEDKHLLLNLIFELRKLDFEVARYDERGLLSIIRDNEYIDIYFFEKDDKGFRRCCGEYILEKYLLNLEIINFLNCEFLVPKESVEFLKFEYGANWNIPIEYKVSPLNRILNLLKVNIKHILPNKIVQLILHKKELKAKQLFLRKVSSNC